MGSMSMKHSLLEMMDSYIIYLSMPCLLCLHHFIISCSCTALRFSRKFPQVPQWPPLGWIQYPQMTWWWLYISKWELFHLTKKIFWFYLPLDTLKLFICWEKRSLHPSCLFIFWISIRSISQGKNPWCRPQTLGSRSRQKMTSFLLRLTMFSMAGTEGERGRVVVGF